jgi:hypothetical protein
MTVEPPESKSSLLLLIVKVGIQSLELLEPKLLKKGVMKINIQSSITYKLFFIVCIQGLLGHQQVYAASYYVSPSGSNTSPGTLSLPWKTITKAADTLVAGDTVYIRAGIYKEQVVPKNSGNATNGYITYTAYQGETATIDGSNGLSYPSWNGIFSIQNKSYITVSGLNFVHSSSFGVFFEKSTYIKILNNSIYDTANSGILGAGPDYDSYSNNILVDGNTLNYISHNPANVQECLSLYRITDYVISNNTVHDCGMEGIDAKVGSSNGKIFGNNVYDTSRVGIYVDGYDQGITNVDVYNNTVHDSKPIASGASEDGIRIGAELGVAMSNIKLYNNIIYNISAMGIDVSAWTEAGYPEPRYTNVTIYNNTIHNTGTNVGNKWGGGGLQIEGSNNSGIVVRNNIVSKSNDFNIDALVGTTISNNLFNGGTAVGTNAIQGNPLFVNIANADFQLQATSPAINAGLLSGAPSTDFKLAPRSLDGQVDIGAFEYGSAATPPATNTTINISSYSVGTITANEATVNWSTNAPSTGNIYYGTDSSNLSLSAVDSTSSPSHSTRINGLARRTTYYYKIVAKDSGNATATSSISNFRTTWR